MLRVTQFSDLHFSTSGERSHGGVGYDVDDVWDTVFDHAFGGDNDHPDLVVITGDIADRGEPSEYQKAAEKLARLPVHANACPGNHDFHVPFESHLPRVGLTASRTLRLGDWLFVFADSNFSGRRFDESSGRLVDNDDRIESDGQLGPAEVAWIDDTIASTDAANAFIWVHHPPGAIGSFSVPAYDAEIEAIANRHPKLRGVGAGHTHTNSETVVGGIPVHTCPAFTVNVDYRKLEILPPGYRTYEFGDDGGVSSTVHMMNDDSRWPSWKLPEPAVRMLMGEITWEEMTSELE